MINKSSEIPYYLQIYNEIRNRIELQVYKPYELLPSENELVEEFGVTRATVRNAIKKLKDEGRVTTQKGIGSIVNASKIEQNLFNVYSFGRNFEEKSYRLDSDIISINLEFDNGVIQRNLQLGEDSVVAIKRLRKLEGVPVIVETSYIPTKFIPNILLSEIEGYPVYDFLEKKLNFKISKAKEYIEPLIADEYYSKLLEIEEGTPLFMTERVTYTEVDKPMEFRRSVIRSDKFKFSVELK